MAKNFVIDVSGVTEVSPLDLDHAVLVTGATVGQVPVMGATTWEAGNGVVVTGTAALGQVPVSDGAGGWAPGNVASAEVSIGTVVAGLAKGTPIGIAAVSGGTGDLVVATNITLAAPSTTASPWPVGGLSTGTTGASQPAKIIPYKVDTTITNWDSLPTDSGGQVYLSATAGQFSLTPPAVGSNQWKVCTGVVAGISGGTVTILWALGIVEYMAS